MNASQTRAVAAFRKFMESQLNTNPEYGDTLVKFETQTTDYGTLWITAETDMVKLGEGNLLRALDAQHWHVAVGPRGALEVWSAPKSFDQFRGGRAFGMGFRK